MSSISVIIPTFNAALLIERTLRSITSQNGRHDVEIIIVDDCSTDDTLAVVEKPADGVLRVTRPALCKQ